MNWRLTIPVLSAMSAIITCGVAVRAWQAERLHADRAEQGTLIAELTSLTAYREGNITSAVDRLETHVYAIGRSYLRSSRGERTATRKVIVDWLQDYRGKFSRPASEWSPFEHELDDLLRGQ